MWGAAAASGTRENATLEEKPQEKLIELPSRPKAVFCCSTGSLSFTYNAGRPSFGLALLSRSRGRTDANTAPQLLPENSLLRCSPAPVRSKQKLQIEGFRPSKHVWALVLPKRISVVFRIGRGTAPLVRMWPAHKCMCPWERSRPTGEI